MDCDPAVRKHGRQAATSCNLLIPGLPDEIALTILARLPRFVRACLCGVCRSWKHCMEERAAMDAIRKTLHLREVWLIVLQAQEVRDTSLFRIVDPFSGLCSRVYSPPKLRALGIHLDCDVCGVVGREVLISVQGKYLDVPPEVRKLEGLYSFDAACLKWNDAKFSSLPSSTPLGHAFSVDMEGGHLYAETESIWKGIQLVERLDLRTKMWEEYWLDNRARLVLESNLEWLQYYGDEDSFSFTQIRSCYSFNCTWARPRQCRLWWHWHQSGRLVLLKGHFYALRTRSLSVEVMCYIEASHEGYWISLGAIPGTENYAMQSDVLLLCGVGEELWVLVRDGPTKTMMILTTQPSLSEPLSWKMILKRPRLSVDGFPKCVGTMLFP